LATACDFRVCTEGSKFGAPIAKTLSNTLSSRNIARLCGAFSAPQVKRMLMLAEYIDAQQAMAGGYLQAILSRESLHDGALALARGLAALSQVTQSAVKESLRGIQVDQDLADADLIERVYGSAGFRSCVQAYLAA